MLPADFTIQRMNGLKDSTKSKEELIRELKSLKSRLSRIEKGRSEKDRPKRSTLDREPELLRKMMDNLPDFIYVKDTKSRFIEANEAVARIMGAKGPDELIGKTDFEFYPEEIAKKYFNSSVLNDQ